jgi:alkanesulfonate monooxygenase SsuD/methylene tetrahydromethanopterin reductase-like flavin-dependent oxidoreductase (luciferase family)
MGHTTRTRLGIEAENMGHAVYDPGIVAMAQAIEAAGVESISVSDHLLSFSRTNSGAEASSAETWLEALTCLAAMSSVTSRVKLIASVIILPQRNVLELIKVATTINFLSGGRLVLGVGSGWNRREMESLGYGFASRGQRMDEMLDVMRGTRDGAVQPFNGEQIVVPAGIRMSPGGDRSIPLYIGGSGTSAVSIRRTLAYGDGWMPYSMAGGYDADALRRTMGYLREERARDGLAPLDTIFKLGVPGHASPLLEANVLELASIGFDEIIVQGIWDAGIEPGIATIHRQRNLLDA